MCGFFLLNKGDNFCSNEYTAVTSIVVEMPARLAKILKYR